jgi:hypothetical protein
MPGQSRFADLEPLLDRVQKPIQYVGGELNSQVKDWQCGGHGPGGEELTVRWALMYPDAYEVGLPNQGVMILYEVLNERPHVLAERTYAVWPDLEALLRESGVPQLTVDGHRAVVDFDLFGVSFSTELGYTNFLTAIDLAGIPLHSKDRGDGTPIVIAGGHASFNPEPIADFVDAVVVGDGEQAVLEITDLVAAWKAQGSPGGRDELLMRIARSGVAYVPSCYEVDYFPDGRIRRVAPRTGLTGIPWRVSKHTVTDLDAWPYPKAPLVPLAETVHERMSVEIFRGCTRGCRFCQAGMITRPVRERSITGIGEMVERGLAATGFEEVGLLSLSSADHSEIAEVTKGLADRYEGSQTGLSLPSTRVDAFNIDLANELSRGGPSLRPHLRARGRLRAAAQGHQQAGVRAGSRRHGGGGLRLGLAAGEALLHVWASHRDRRGRTADRDDGQAGHRDRSPGERPPRHPMHGVDRRLRAQAAHPFPMGGAARVREATDERLQLAARHHPGRPPVCRSDRLPLPRRAAGHRRGTALAGRPARRCRHRGGVARRWSVRRLE